MHTSVGCSEGHPAGNSEQLSANNNEENRKINGCGFLICFQESLLLVVGFCLN